MGICDTLSDAGGGGGVDSDGSGLGGGRMVEAAVTADNG